MPVFRGADGAPQPRRDRRVRDHERARRGHRPLMMGTRFGSQEHEGERFWQALVGTPLPLLNLALTTSVPPCQLVPNTVKENSRVAETDRRWLRPRHLFIELPNCPPLIMI